MRSGRPARPIRPCLPCLGTLAMVLAPCGHVESAAGLQAGKQPWTTAPGYRIDEPEGTSSGFGRFSRMRVG